MKNLSTLDVIDYPKFIISNNAINVIAIANAYDLSQSEMTKLLNRKKQQVDKIFNKKKYSPEKEDIKKVFQDLIEIYILIRALLKKPRTNVEKKEIHDKIIHWFRIPNPAYKGESPFELIAKGKGYIVIDSLNDELYGIPS